jgi:hypothetical protein
MGLNLFIVQSLEMKQIFTLSFFLVACTTLRAQVVLNEIYTSPGADKHEFFELYNSGTESTPISVDGFSIVTYFEQGATKGFYVLDLPSLFINPHGFFVGSSAMPFNYQGTTNSTSSNFSWNSPTLTASSGYLKKWVLTGSDASDGNASYNEAAIPANFNDFFTEKGNGGANFSIFVFKNGILINSFYGGVGGATNQPSFITSMPSLNVSNVIGVSSSTFTINFGGFTANQAEYATASAGSDNGYIRAVDGACITWNKSSATSTHTPGVSNGAAGAATGTVTVSGFITRGILPATTSTVTYDITAGVTTAFPVELRVYTDNGNIAGEFDVLDTYITSTTQTSLADGYTTTSFSPASANIIIVAKTAAGCFGEMKLLTSSNSTLPVKLISFNGNVKDGKATLTWKVDLNETADKFEVERSSVNGKFTTIGTVFANSSNGVVTYHFSDPSPVNEKVAYRLRMTDKNQFAEYSKIISFNTNGTSDNYISLLQNPVYDKLNISFQTQDVQTADIRLIDMTGSVKASMRVNVQAGNNVLYFPLPATLATGAYVVSVSHSKGMFNRKFLKQ